MTTYSLLFFNYSKFFGRKEKKKKKIIVFFLTPA